MDQLTPTGSPDLVDARRGLVARAAFTSDEIFRQEMAQIFDRVWGFVAHESEIPNPGDYVVRRLGSAEVIVVRDATGARVLLNSCKHRGAKLCRADSGTARNFVCPYHGWSYERDGTLITTTFDRHLPADLARSELNLVVAPRVEIFCGLIFACWNRDVAPLDDYLNDFGWYLKAFLARTPGGMEVLAPPHRWRTKSNWKVGALNFIGDSQHILTTHTGPLTLDPVRAAQKGFTKPGERSFQLVTDNGHGATITYLAEGMPEEAYRTHPAALRPLYEALLAPAQLGVLDRLRVAVGTIFPNLSFIEAQCGPAEKAIILRIWQPISGTEMEVLSWVLAEREADADYKSRVLRNGFRNFGAAGVFEQDDLELWAAATQASDNPIAAAYPYSFHTALPYMDKPDPYHDLPGRAYRPSDTEVAQLAFMMHWQQMMTRDASHD